MDQEKEGLTDTFTITKKKNQHENTLSDNRNIAEHNQDFYTSQYTATRSETRVTNEGICNIKGRNEACSQTNEKQQKRRGIPDEI